MGKILIIGSGPAGISAALYAKRGGADVTVFTKGTGALAKAERIENYYGLPEPVSGETLNRNGIAGARRLGVQFVQGEVVGLGMDDTWTRFTVATADASYTGDSVILAAGASRIVPPLPGLAELEGHGVSYCAVCDAAFYKKKVTGVLGNGAYALHEAEVLRPHAAKVILLTDGKEMTVPVPPDFAVRTEKLTELQSTTENGRTRIRGVRLENGEVLALDGLFVALGTAGSTELARKMGARVEAGHVQVDRHMATNVPGLFAAGDCTGGLLQVVKAAYEGAEAGLSALRYVRNKEKGTKA
ncbi:MAG: NAD(P)/FAD-dependent oxidoreductase [Succiniclasticum sp.]|jgi:thioredoxin reductase (NADPH)|nr:NAD(P)/FAD-dependent oxidoreductase [Succiniclasticum sp.]MEE3478850.1 NAD(P)/FAD-dependent oxidoreductase [Succiniclasticum sp.]